MSKQSAETSTQRAGRKPGGRPPKPNANLAGTAGAPGTVTGSIPTGGSAGTSGGTIGDGTVVAGGQTGDLNSLLGEEVITWGTVDSYSVDDERLMIKLVTGAIGRELIAVRADAPHFRSAVSMAMMAHHTPGTKVSVRYLTPTSASAIVSNPLEIRYALELGIGSEPDKTLSFDDWKIDLP
jgi:hypothetical protein